MNYKVKSVPDFDKEAKRIAKKYRALKNDLAKLIDSLEENPTLGTHLGQNVYKIRLAITDTNKGKSGGARVITCVTVVRKTVYLTAIYLKTEYNTVNLNKVINRLKDSGFLS